MSAGPPLENKNAEKWTIKEATKLMNEAYKLSFKDEYDFIGEIARDLKTYRTIFDYFVVKFPDLHKIYNKILGNLEANCFQHSKKGVIKEATAIVNLKSNYHWKDRQDIDLKDDRRTLDNEQREARIEELKEKLGVKE